MVISGKAIPPFFRLASNAFPDIGSVARLDFRRLPGPVFECGLIFPNSGW